MTQNTPSLTVTILGCGASGGVPLITGYWGNCDPLNPKNVRTRSSIALTIDQTVWLIDMTPDLRAQCLRENITRIDGVLCTHTHFDHIAGLDELKPFSFAQKKPIPLYASAEHLEELRLRFPYAFPYADESYSPDIYKHFIEPIVIDKPFDIQGVPVIPILQDHRYSVSLGFRFPSFAYSTDVWQLDDHAMDALKDLDVWIVDCLDIAPRATHTHWERTSQWIHELRPRKTILTHMSHFIDFQTFGNTLPQDVFLAYDGMQLLFP